jgi:UDP-N-acetylmuramoyl-tripeptide--D-alanyl-D-alanine ligase
MMSNSTPMFSIDQVIKAVGGVLIAGAAQNTVCGISTDSRQVERGNIFIALHGENFDGHDFVHKAMEKGAASVIISNEALLDLEKVDKAVSVIKVSDTLQALGDLAHNYRQRFSLSVIGLTGSSGKTTTKEMMATIIGRKKTILKTEGNLNNLIGLPQTIFRLRAEHELAILEMGTNTRGEIKRLTRIAEPIIGLITNIGPAHLAGFGSVDVVAQEKGDLFLNMSPAGIAVVNLDDEAVKIIAERWNGRRINFSMSPNADVTVNDIEKNGARGMRFNLVIDGTSQKVEMKIVGIHHVYNTMAAAASAWAAGIGPETIKEGLETFSPVGGRMEMIKLQNGAYVIDDSYNANPASVREALMTLKDLKKHHSGYVFLGDMLELGDAAEEMHRRIGMLLGTIGVNAVFLQGEYSAITAAAAQDGGLPRENIFIMQDSKEGIAYLKKYLEKGDWVLVKGSRRMKMEMIVAQICEEFGSDKNIENNNKVH